MKKTTKAIINKIYDLMTSVNPNNEFDTDCVREILQEIDDLTITQHISDEEFRLFVLGKIYYKAHEHF